MNTELVFDTEIILFSILLAFIIFSTLAIFAVVFKAPQTPEGITRNE